MSAPEQDIQGYYAYSLQVFEGHEVYQTMLFSTMELAEDEYAEQMKVGYRSNQLVISPVWVITS